MKKGYIFLSFLMSLCICQVSYTQDDKLGTKVIDIIKPYTPNINNAFKEASSIPVKDTILITRKALEYNIHSVPVASMYIPEKGQVMPLKHQPGKNYFDSFVALGFGNYASLLGEAYLHYPIDKNTETSFSLLHNSSQEGVKKSITDSNFATTLGEIQFKKFSEDYALKASLGVENELLHWYGVENNLLFPLVEHQTLRQVYTRINLSGEALFYPTKLRQMNFHLNIIKDYFDNSEMHLRLAPRYRLRLTDNHFINLNLGLDYIRGKFEHSFYFPQRLRHQNLLLQGLPSYRWVNEVLELNVGVFVGLFSDKNGNEKNNYFKIFPNIDFSYWGVSKLFIPSIGVEVLPKVQSFNTLTKENPFVSPTLELCSKLTYKGYLGFKGNVQERIHYQANLFYERIDNDTFFTSNVGYQLPLKSYHYDNSFKVIYDKSDNYGIELNVDGNSFENLTFFGKIRYQHYNPKNQDKAWNIPAFFGRVGGNYRILPSWQVGTTLIYVGNRSELSHLHPRKELSLSGFFDVSFQTDYTFANRWTIFMLLNNITGENYNLWAFYPVQGFGIQMGLKYQFNLIKK